MQLWLAIFASFLALYALMVGFAWADHFATVADMQNAHGFAKGIPLTGHMACLVLDAVPFPALMATWVVMYGRDWNPWPIFWVVIIGFVFSGLMHLTYIDAGKKFPEFVTYSGKLTPAGWIHVIYMGYGFAIIGLAYLCTVHPVPWLVWTSTAYLIVHVTIGVHVIHKLWAPAWFPYHGILDGGTLGPIFGATAMILGLAWWALR